MSARENRVAGAAGAPRADVTISIEPAAERRGAICDAILHELPDWFGLPDALAHYVAMARRETMLVASDGAEPIGFVVLRRMNPTTAEIHVMAVRRTHHRGGVGEALVTAAERRLLAEGIEFLTVKTLAPEVEFAPYAATRAFYRAMGFRPLEVFPTLWSPENPCLFLAKTLREARRFTAQRLVVASHNKGKLREIEALLAPYGLEILAAGALGLPEPEETGSSFRENAALKARAAALEAKLPALADDSGLAVAALGGAPGIYSARWAGPEKDFALAMRKVEAALREAGALGPEPPRARFVSALSLAWPDGHVETFEGRVDGTLGFPPRGRNGFGYDPIFTADGERLSFGEMMPAEKHAISHRADAFRQLVRACFAP
jgi:XTP/dITP diphosphohydrolase